MDHTENFIKQNISELDLKIDGLNLLLATETDTEVKRYVEEEKDVLIGQKEALEASLNQLSVSVSGNYRQSAEATKDNAQHAVNPNACILEVRAGTGGDEAGLFAGDLYNMYYRFAEKKGWLVSEITKMMGSAGEIRTVTAEIKGANAYTLLKNESGVHRVQRVPTTESAGRIHTSTATVAVLPEVSPIEVEINPADVKLVFFHASGHGGQNVNKVQTAVRVEHVPTGIIAESQEQRNQAQNREKAMQILRSRLYEMMQEQQKSKVDELRAGQVGTGTRSEKIRTYNFPQDRITDHRLKASWHNIPMILNGDIEDMINATSTIQAFN